MDTKSDILILDLESPGERVIFEVDRTMSEDEKSFNTSSEGYDDYVTAVVARNRGEAEQYRDLLSDHDIPAIVDDEELDDDDDKASRSKGITHGVQVLVPEVLLDEASEVIADREDVEDFDIDDELDEDEDDDEDLGLDTEIDPDEDDDLFLDDDDDEYEDEPFEDGLDDDEDF